MTIKTLLNEASAGTPDPERASKNLERLLDHSPEFLEAHARQITTIARLFAYSQFLADYSIKNPANLSFSLRNLYYQVNKEEIVSEARRYFEVSPGRPFTLERKEALKLLRDIKKIHLLRITLRDILGITSLNESMAELSTLSEALIEIAFAISLMLMKERFGDLKGCSMAIIGLGKLGARELNYSSDIDIISVYRPEEYQSSGILTPSGVRANRIYSSEYFCRLTEIMAGLLHSQTEDGVAYRVDLRLRPNGQKGEIALSLNSYISYYESWGKTWERMALIRGRPVAGDSEIGQIFINAIEPFVWKRSIDYGDFEEIREIKRKIDTISDINDIKRGYGGIREVEFFVQTFQLLYGGERKKLRTGMLCEALQGLYKEGLLSIDDVTTLSQSYLFFRRLEHILQMKDDVQTHSVPSQPDEIEILSRKMNFHNGKEFISQLRLRRLMVRDMYNSLLGGAETQNEVMAFLESELSEDALEHYLSFKGFRHPGTALKNVNALYEQMSFGKTMKERGLLRKIVPLFLQEIMKSGNKDRALGMLVTFIEKIGNHESYIDLLLRRHDTIEMIVSTFTLSKYLTRLLLSLENLEGLFEYPDIRRDFSSVEIRLLHTLMQGTDPLKTIRELKIIEEMKSGLLFLKGFLNVYGLARTLSVLADTIVKVVVRYLNLEKDFAVVALGGFGARELNIGSDLDLVFVGEEDSGDISPKERSAEELIRFLSEYTEKGIAYKVDMRLRPDGSKGVLLNSIDGYRNYYLKSAHLWEIQSLLRARPVAGDRKLLRAFDNLKKMIILKRGIEVNGSVMERFRKRIIHEVSRESPGSYDIKYGPGGIKEIEFLVQYLQLKNIERFRNLVIYNTVATIKSLSRYAVLHRDTEEFLLQSHRFLRTTETILRLNGEVLLKVDSELIDIITGFLNLRSKEDLINRIEETKNGICEITQEYY
ncbi:MAG: bifunctional [glutamate--ammonia ligase]-adenylyl-L-tyrosine phosphorylase/[glutamate--ammonia-ligase] adenylyltransferase [Nitrospirota bacterium]